MSGVLNWVLEWHKRACPQPDDQAFHVQLGCHLEEVAEMLEALDGCTPQTRLAIDNAMQALDHLATGLKSGKARVLLTSRQDVLDSLADQMVTAVGVGYRAGMQPVEALTEVDISNWSKFDEKGQPIFDDNGKVKKGPNYKTPDLKGLT
jgi:predicted HAD superfamily Cof-like phosphohydrolase